MKWIALLLGGTLSLGLAAAAALSLLWTPYGATEIDVLHRLLPPGPVHWLGTDQYGRDVLSQLMAGARVSLGVAAVSIGLGLGVGVPAGLAAAARGGWLDTVLMRLCDVAFAFPVVLTAVMVSALTGLGTMNAIVAIGLFTIPVFARVARAAALPVWRRAFVLAAVVAGRGPWAITWAHVLPSIAGTLLVQAAIQFALAIGAEAGLAYVGQGTRPPTPSWGRMLNEAQSYIYPAPLLAVFAGLAITLGALALNLLADGLLAGGPRSASLRFGGLRTGLRGPRRPATPG